MEALKFAMLETDQLMAQVVDGLVVEQETNGAMIDELRWQVQNEQQANNSLRSEIKEQLVDKDKLEVELSALR